MSNYMTRKQYERHMQATRRTEQKLAEARLKVGEAASHGDLSENAEYEAAIEESGFLAGRVEELKSQLVGVQIIDPASTMEGMVTIGKTLVVRNLDTDAIATYQIVGNGIADTDGGEVSYFAPLGRALIGKREGDAVTVTLPEGTTRVRLESVRFSD